MVYYSRHWARRVYDEFYGDYARVMDTIMVSLLLSDGVILKWLTHGRHKLWYYFKRMVKKADSVSLSGVLREKDLIKVLKTHWFIPKVNDELCQLMLFTEKNA